MGRLRSGSWRCVIAVLLAVFVNGCGGHRPPGVLLFPARVNLVPNGSTSMELGTTITFTATAQNSSGTTVSTTFVYASSDPSILNVAPNGVACAGVWSEGYTTCTPGGTGIALVTVSAQGATGITSATSAPTYVFVHPPIDNVTVTGVLLNNVPIQEPCLSQGQTMTVEAHAFSQGTDITSSVGTFAWSINNNSVASVTPIVNLAYTVPTNLATVTAAFPGITQVYATASGVTSTSFQQPQLKNAQGTTSPILDFFETCPIQNITLELNHAGSLQNTFSVSKSTPESVVATLTDVMGNSTLPNTIGGVVLNKIPLVWTASQPGVVSISTACVDTCTLSTPSPGAGSVTASCTPPTCNIGFPETPAVLSTQACADYFQLTSCQEFIPVPVYATTAISGLIQGTPTLPGVLATSLGCSAEAPVNCNTAMYSPLLTKGSVGGTSFTPAPPNSLQFDIAGDRAYMGSDFGAQVVSPASLGSSTSAFTALSTVTGRVIATSFDGNFALFSDTAHTPNQVYLVNSSNSSTGVIPLNISGASAAAFSPDGLKAFIFGYDSNGNPNLYIYSALQALQTIPLPPQTTVNSIVFSTNGAFAYVVEPSLNGAGPAFTVYNTCNNQVSTTGAPGDTPQIIPLTAPPIGFRALPDGIHFIALETGGSIDYITANITGIPIATFQQTTSLCPMTVSHTKLNFNLQQGDISVLNFFPSADGTLLYVLANERSGVLVYDFTNNSISRIPLVNNAIPISGGISIDDSTIILAGSDGMLHQVSTSIGGSDQQQLSFPNLPDFLNPFCNFTPASGPCTFDTVLVRP